MIGSMRDVTNLKTAEVEQVNQTRRRNILLSYISHELRTPITSIAGYLTAIQDGTLVEEDDQKEAMGIITSKTLTLKKLIARIKAHLRRQKSYSSRLDAKPSTYEVGDMNVDFELHECRVSGEEVNLTSKEFDILRLLIENPRKVFPASQIFEEVWKTSCMENDHKTVMVYISTLRKKLGPHDDSPSYIMSVRGVGYKFNQSLLEK